MLADVQIQAVFVSRVKWDDGTLYMFYSYSDDATWWCRFEPDVMYAKIHGNKLYGTSAVIADAPILVYNIHDIVD